MSDDGNKKSDKVVYGSGNMIFEQGDEGGDLYFIEEGEVEILTHKDNQQIVLTTMKAGEIIGVMTCLTGEPRLASARAKGEVVCKKVPRMNIQKVHSSMPKWMKIVIKEYTIRIQQMNSQFSDSSFVIDKLEKSQANHVFKGAQLGAAFAGVAEYFMTKDPDTNEEVVLVEDLMDRLEIVLNFERSELDRLLKVLVDSGLLKLEIERDRRRTIASKLAAKRMEAFAKFVKDSARGEGKKLLRANFSHKETRTLSAIVKLTQKLDMDTEKECKLAVSQLKSSLEKVTGVSFARDSLDKAAKLNLIVIEEGEGETVVFKPGTLGRTIACIEAVRRLQVLDEAKYHGKNNKNMAA